MFRSVYLLIPFVLQLLWIGIDELYFHHKRALPKWERVGHPLDTLTVLACLFWIIFVTPNETTVGIYVGLSIFSSVFILKDETVHREQCDNIEHWLHILLFTLHPLVLISAGLLWPAVHAEEHINFPLVSYEGWERPFFLSNLTIIILFLFYQTIYWNLIWKPSPTTKTETQSHFRPVEGTK